MPGGLCGMIFVRKSLVYMSALTGIKVGWYVGPQSPCATSKTARTCEGTCASLATRISIVDGIGEPGARVALATFNLRHRMLVPPSDQAHDNT